MPGVVNTSFEIAGPLPGIAQSWHRRGSRVGGGLTQAGFAERAFDNFTAPTDLADASWAPSDTTVVPDAATAPDGTSDADNLRETATVAVHYLAATNAITFYDGHTYTVGCYLKIRTTPYAGIGIPTSGGRVLTLVNLTTGVISLYPTPVDEVDDATVTVLMLPDGWVQVSLTVKMTADLATQPEIWVSFDGTDAAYDGTGKGGVYAWGAFVYEGGLRLPELFESGWLGGEDRAVVGATTPALFTTDLADPISSDKETFESGWLGNTLFTAEIVGVEDAFFDPLLTTPTPYEDFEEFWQGSTGVTYPSITTSVVATFNALSYEAFDSGWEGSENRSEQITGSVLALFDGVGAESKEDYEEGFEDLEYNVDIGTDILTSVGHGLSLGDTVYVVSQFGGKIPTGTNGTVKYYVDVLTADTLKLRTGSLGGPVVDFISVGEGLQYLRADPSRFWWGLDIDLAI